LWLATASVITRPPLVLGALLRVLQRNKVMVGRTSALSKFINPAAPAKAIRILATMAGCRNEAGLARRIARRLNAALI
jgi:hypothetical protein